MQNRKSKQAKACDIPARVKREVWERDQGRCVLCGASVNTAPNAHYISRAHGGLGIPENIVTLCTGFGPGSCHDRYDNGTKEEREAAHSGIPAKPVPGLGGKQAAIQKGGF